MSAVTTWKIDDRLLRTPQMGSKGFIWFRAQLTIAGALNGDTIEMFNFPKQWMPLAGVLLVEGTLGASCTLTPRRASTAVGAASTAAAASGTQHTAALLTSGVDDDATIFSLLVGGADIAASAWVNYFLDFVETPGWGPVD